MTMQQPSRIVDIYRQAAEHAFIDETLSRDEAAVILGEARLEELEYAKQALAEDVIRGLEM